MHEMGIALQIIDIASAAIPKELGSLRIEKINLRIGKLSAVVPESLRFCFNVVSSDTPLAGSTLSIEEVPISVKCRDCNVVSEICDPPFICKECGSGSIDILTGREFLVTSIEVADPCPE